MLPEQRPKEEETVNDQKQKRLMGHTHPRCLQGVEWRVFLPKKNRAR
jgi:hypothetical protein